MAANFLDFNSPLLDPEEVDVVHQLDKERGFTLEDFKLIEMHMANSTAVTYMRRVYTRLLQDAVMGNSTQSAWRLVNDTYKMDLILIHLPHLIALACIYVASVLKDKENTAWFEELRVDMNVVKNIAMEILDFYDGHKLITEESVQNAMHKLGPKL